MQRKKGIKSKKNKNLAIPESSVDKFPVKKEDLKEFEKKLMDPIIDRVRTLRIAANYSSEELSAKLGMSLTAYASIEQKLTYFSVPKLIRLKKLLKKDYLYILEGLEEPKAGNVTSESEKDKEIAHLKKELAMLEENISLLKQLYSKK
jgi:transcriptional regulator with XRE-family HTH domain